MRLSKGRANYATFAQFIFRYLDSLLANAHQRASESVLGPYASNAYLYMHPFTRRMTSKNNAKLYSIGTLTHTFEIFVAILQQWQICHTPLLHNCHTVAQMQHSDIIATVIYRQQWQICHTIGCSRFVPIAQFCSRFVLGLRLFTFCSLGPLLFHFCSQPWTKQEQNENATPPAVVNYFIVQCVHSGGYSENLLTQL